MTGGHHFVLWNRQYLRSRHRPMIAALLLCIIFAHGTIELASVLAAGGRRSANEKTVVEIRCTCTCSGTQCRMGAKCCCDAAKVPVRRPAGLFFAPLGCQSDAPLAGPILVSSGFRFLEPEGLSIAAASYSLHEISFNPWHVTAAPRASLMHPPEILHLFA